MQCIKRLKALASLALFSTAGIQAGTLSTDFTTQPAGSQLFGTAVLSNAVLRLTAAVNDQSGSFILPEVDPGSTVWGFDLNAKLRIGGGSATPADGMSINFAPDVPEGTFGEEGTGTGLTITFDIYDNGAAEAPSIDLKLAGATIAQRKLTIAEITTTGTNFTDLAVQFRPNGLFNLAYKGNVVFTNLLVPGYQGLAGARFGFGARTGGLNANQWLDDLSITTYTRPESAIITQPASATAITGRTAIFNVQITNPEGATYQWLRNGTPVAGATTSTLSLTNVAATDAGARYSVRITAPNNSLTSTEAVLSVVDIPGPVSPKISFNFNDGVAPAGTIVTNAVVEATGGVDNSGVLKLTINENDQAGAFIIEDVEAGAAVTGFTAEFDVRIGGGTATPADGFSFNLTPVPPADPIAGGLEEGYGTGITVAFDIYDNGGGEAPSIDVKYNGNVIASRKYPISFLDTGDGFADVLIRLENDGTMDVAYKGTLVHSNVFVTGFTSITNGQYILAARTGGLNANQWVDNLRISNELTPGPLRISTQPGNLLALLGRPATFSADVNLATGTTFQWLRNGQTITGATSNSLTLPTVAVADTGASYQLRATLNGTSVTSSNAVLTVVNLAAPTTPTVSFDFNNATVPANTAVAGTAVVEASGGVGDSGVLKLTIAQNDQNGGFLIQPLLGGAEIGSIVAAFDLMLDGGSGTPADGFSFNWGTNLPPTSGEEGAATGLTITFDIYDNGGAEAPSIDVKWKGTVIASTKLTIPEIETADAFRRVLVQVSQDGKVDLAYGDRVLYSGLQITNYAAIPNGQFGFYARTGGLNENQWVDNIQILAVKSTAPLRITQAPVNTIALQGTTATFTVALSDPNGATYQWYRNGAPIAGATSTSFTTAALTPADSGGTYRVIATGPGGTVTSSEVTLTVVPPITVTNPVISFDFEGGATPENTTIAGSALVDSGVLKLTEAANSLTGSFVIADRNTNQAVSDLPLPSVCTLAAVLQRRQTE